MLWKGRRTQPVSDWSVTKMQIVTYSNGTKLLQTLTLELPNLKNALKTIVVCLGNFLLTFEWKTERRVTAPGPKLISCYDFLGSSCLEAYLTFPP